MAEPKVDTFSVVVRDDSDSPWTVMMTGTPRQARTTMVAEAGAMARLPGYSVVGISRNWIVVQTPEGRTQFRMRRVTDDG